MHACMHTLHTYIHTLHTYLPTYLPTYLHTDTMQHNTIHHIRLDWIMLHYIRWNDIRM